MTWAAPESQGDYRENKTLPAFARAIPANDRFPLHPCGILTKQDVGDMISNISSLPVKVMAARAGTRPATCFSLARPSPEEGL